jgi:hypothetical protein
MAQNILAWKCNCKTLEDIDLFSKSPDIYYKGKPQKSSIFGRILTISYGVIYAAFFIYKIVRMALKIDVSFIETQTWTGEIPSLRLNNNHFYGGFALMNPLTFKPFIDESIYYTEAIFRTGIKKNSESDFTWEDRVLEVEPCQLEKFGKDFRDLFKGKVDGLYCLKDVDVTIQGHTTLDAYSYFYVTFYPCINGKRGRTNCAPQEFVKQVLNQNLLMVKMEDIELTPQKYNSPIQVRTRELSAPVMDSLYNNIQAYFHIIDMQTDNDILGFEMITNKVREKHFKYDVTFMVNSINTELPTDTGEAYCNIQLQLTEQMISIERTYTKLVEVLGDVGGLMEFIFSFFKLISIFITEALYEKGLINHLFSFDLDKKLIEFKNPQKSKEIVLSNEPEVFKPIDPNYKLSSQIQIYGSGGTIRKKDTMKDESENKINNDLVSFSPKNDSPKIKRKRKIKKKKSTNITNFIKPESEETKSKNVFKNNIKDENEVIRNSNDNDFDEKAIKETEKTQRKKITKVKFNCVDLYICFLCTRRRKKVENILIDEGMNLFTEKLDVINIFSKLLKLENFENINKDAKPLGMSDECKIRLEKMKYPKDLT